MVPLFVSLACAVSSNDDTDASTTTSNGDSTTTSSTTTPMSTSDTSTTAPEPTDTSTTSSTDDTTSSSETTGDASSSTTESTESSSDDSGSSDSTTGGLLPPCEAGCMTEFSCSEEWKSVEACITWCEGNLVKAGAFSQFCQTAWSNLSACFGTLDCEEYGEYLEPSMFPYPCVQEADSLAFECKGQ